MQKKHKPLTVANLISRLPLQQQLKSSHAILIKLTPIWNAWVIESVRKKLISSNCLYDTQLSSLQNGKLTITCNNSAVASLIKHQQDSLLTFLRKQGFEEIEQIVIRINNQSKQINHHFTEANNSSARSNVKTSHNALEAIYNCQKSVENDLLADSLKKLANTLKNKV